MMKTETTSPYMIKPRAAVKISEIKKKNIMENEIVSELMFDLLGQRPEKPSIS